MVALVDDEDFEALNRFKWCAKSSGAGLFYAYRATGKRSDGSRVYQFMHRLLVQGDGFVDHINGNGLDNRRDNLRLATSSQNGINRRKALGTTSRYKGVTWSKKDQRWCAQIKRNGKNRFLGSFRSEEEAAKAYDAAARELFGEFAKLNKV